MKKHLSVGATLSSLLVISCAVGIISFQGCQKQDYAKEDPLDPVILNSPELEEFVIAGADFRQSLNTLEDEIRRIDFSKQESIDDIKSGEITSIPIFFLGIAEKVQAFNERKASLLAKYPQFASLTEQEKSNYFRTCIYNSYNVNKKLLELGININQPRTKGDIIEQFSSMEDVMTYLKDWMERSDYVEIALIKYEDGTIVTYVDSKHNTPKDFHVGLETRNNDGKRYFPQGGSESPVVFVGHTHTSGPDPSVKDKTTLRDGIESSIYYNGAWHAFNKDTPAKS